MSLLRFLRLPIMMDWVKPYRVIDPVSNEARHLHLCQVCERGGLYQFGKIIISHNNKLIPVRCFRVHTNFINFQHLKAKSWLYYARSRQPVGLVNINLAEVTLADVHEAVSIVNQ